MLKLFILCPFFFLSNSVKAGIADSTISFMMDDSVKAVQYLATIKMLNMTGKKEKETGIRTNLVSLSLEMNKKKKEISFAFPNKAIIVAKGMQVIAAKGELEWEYNWETDVSYKLLLATAADSAGNFILYSGYIWLPAENKWKLIGTCKIEGQWGTIRQPAVYFTGQTKKTSVTIETGEAWIQRSNGSWKNLKEEGRVAPVVLVSNHLDSIAQLEFEQLQIKKAIAERKSDAKLEKDGIWFTMEKEGTGTVVKVTDTVTVFYKGYLFSDGTVFDQTKEKPATFPLNRLIKGWQLGLPLCKVGGKIKLVIPSAFAYSVRTRAAKIPPNSILVFEIEVVSVK